MRKNFLNILIICATVFASFSPAFAPIAQAQGSNPDPRPYNNLAWLYYTQGIKLEEAENLARRAVALAPASEDTPYRDTLDQILKARSQGGRSSQTQSQ